MVINNNLQANKAAHNLGANEARLNKSLTRLSSGLRITDATDDAAGLAVSMRLDAQLKRLEAAKTNAANALSLAQMQDGYLSKIAKALDRMSELSMMAQDVIKSDQDRSLYNSEFLQLANFIRDAANKSFNGVTLFSPSNLDVAIDSEGNIFTMKGVDLGKSTYNSAFYPQTPSFTQGFFTVNGYKVTVDPTDSLDSIMARINTATKGTVSATYTGDQIQLTGTGTVSLGSSDDTSNFLDITQLQGNGSATVASATSASWSPKLGSLNFATSIEDGFITVGTFSIAVNTTDTMQQLFDRIKTTTGGDITASYNWAADTISMSSASGAFTLGSASDTSNFLTAAKLSSDGSSSVTSSGEISSFLTSVAAAKTTLAKVKDAIVQLANDRGLVGANQTRLSYTMEQLQVHKENITAATSRIEDVDVATESTEYAKANILVQAATSMLAQANTTPQNVLKLLQ